MPFSRRLVLASRMVGMALGVVVRVWIHTD